MHTKKPKVSACIITYNHEKFLRKCLDGAISQNLDFPYEIVIGEDKSTDNTLAICKEYQNRYPDLIRLIERPANLGMLGNWTGTLGECNGEYIAVCEGDDYWIDPDKLKKQIDFLDNNKQYVLCGSKVKSSNENGEEGESGGKKYGAVSLEDILWRNQFTTCSVVLRKEALDIPPFKNFSRYFTPDWTVWCSVLQYGKGYNFKEITAQYNIHSAGATSGRNRVNALRNKLEDRMLMIENFPAHKQRIKKYGLKIIFHYMWKSLLLKKSYSQALSKNRKLVLNYLNC
ncbi:glycosyltransferase [Zunongwangia sp. F363]|uniref:Glycosyltransferase n=1 Tax=Autumnicola tepida TaxID=3075595 RepID=A0ABU3CD31_9FLAO|nr:glycosyltransferase [Zunongwangia sp. F363]MDT0644240.1 glycosyltransferase [Zunongwangia sp. F363]